jgi:CheY-like chemotaxis protein
VIAAVASRTVLVVDDSPQDLALIRAAFHDLGPTPQLRFAESGDAAQAYLEGQAPFGDRAVNPAPDLILLDIQMPVRDGFDVLRWIRAQVAEWAQCPVIMLTTSHDTVEIRRAYELGANSFLTKPTGFLELREIVRELVSYWLVRNRGR